MEETKGEMGSAKKLQWSGFPNCHEPDSEHLASLFKVLVLHRLFRTYVLSTNEREAMQFESNNIVSKRTEAITIRVRIWDPTIGVGTAA